jgi:hypothetical protein
VYLFPTFLILIQFSSTFLIIVNVCSLCLLLGTTGQTVTVACNDGYSGGGIATCGTSGEFNTLICTVTVTPPKSVSLLVSKNDQLQIEITPSDINKDITHYEGDMLVAISGKTVGELQSIETVGATSWKHFTIGTGVGNVKHFLVVANCYDGSIAQARAELDSVIYEYDATRTSDPFHFIQQIPTLGAYDFESFEINGEHFLVVANQRKKKGSSWDYVQDSIIYKYQGNRFVTEQPFQRIPTLGAVDWEYFKIDIPGGFSRHFLVVANYYSVSTGQIVGPGHSYDYQPGYEQDSFIYEYNVGNKQFEYFQAIPTIGAIDWEYFNIGGKHYLVVANHVSKSTGAAVYAQKSKMYELNLATTACVEKQEFQTEGAIDWEHFKINGLDFLVVANKMNDNTYKVKSVIYKYDYSVSGDPFVTFQSIDTIGASDFEYWYSGGKHYLIVANQRDANDKYDLDSIIYEYDTTRTDNNFQQNEIIKTTGAFDWESFFIGDKHFL